MRPLIFNTIIIYYRHRHHVRVTFHITPVPGTHSSVSPSPFSPLHKCHTYVHHFRDLQYIVIEKLLGYIVMTKTRALAIGGILTGLAVLFQTIPAILTETFVFMTVVSTLPVYLASRLSPKTGLCTFSAAAVLVMLVSLHEGLLFIFTNGILGLISGIASYYFKRKIITALMSSLVLTCSLGVVNYIICIPVFGFKIPGAIWMQLAGIFVFSFIYSSVYLYVSNIIFDKMFKLGINFFH